MDKALELLLVLVFAVLGLFCPCLSGQVVAPDRTRRAVNLPRFLRGPVPQRGYLETVPEDLPPSAATAQGKHCSWLEQYKCAELLARGLTLQDTNTRHLAMISTPNVDSTSFVSPEASVPPACCPNAPVKKMKSMRRRPDDENEADNMQLPLARKLSF